MRLCVCVCLTIGFAIRNSRPSATNSLFTLAEQYGFSSFTCLRAGVGKEVRGWVNLICRVENMGRKKIQGNNEYRFHNFMGNELCKFEIGFGWYRHGLL